MPKSQRPRHLRLVPPYKRDLQNDEYAEQKAIAERSSQVHSDTQAEQAMQRADIAARQHARARVASARRNKRFVLGAVGLAAAAEGVKAFAGRKKIEASKMYNVTSGTNVRRVTPRTPSGQFVSHTNDLMVIHPTFKTDGRRAARDSTLQVWGKGKDKASQTFVGKADTLSLTEALNAGGNSRGRRLA